jgi:hypothetical protein
MIRLQRTRRNAYLYVGILLALILVGGFPEGAFAQPNLELDSYLTPVGEGWTPIMPGGNFVPMIRFRIADGTPNDGWGTRLVSVTVSIEMPSGRDGTVLGPVFLAHYCGVLALARTTERGYSTDQYDPADGNVAIVDQVTVPQNRLWNGIDDNGDGVIDTGVQIPNYSTSVFFDTTEDEVFTYTFNLGHIIVDETVTYWLLLSMDRDAPQYMEAAMYIPAGQIVTDEVMAYVPPGAVFPVIYSGEVFHVWNPELIDRYRNLPSPPPIVTAPDSTVFMGPTDEDFESVRVKVATVTFTDLTPGGGYGALGVSGPGDIPADRFSHYDYPIIGEEGGPTRPVTYPPDYNDLIGYNPELKAYYPSQEGPPFVVPQNSPPIPGISIEFSGLGVPDGVGGTLVNGGVLITGVFPNVISSGRVAELLRDGVDNDGDNSILRSNGIDDDCDGVVDEWDEWVDEEDIYGEQRDARNDDYDFYVDGMALSSGMTLASYLANETSFSSLGPTYDFNGTPELTSGLQSNP